MTQAEIKKILDRKVLEYNNPRFIEKDPISIPHRFSRKADIEIAGFLVATIAWGNRNSIINSALKMLGWMDYSPYEFVKHHQASDLRHIKGSIHRTFLEIDFLYFLHVLKEIYTKNQSLEPILISNPKESLEKNLNHFYSYFFSFDHLDRTRKHISTPANNSACKRLNMYLRWMVRTDNNGVDFGIWNSIKPSQLVIPMDTHVCNVASKLGLISTKVPTWKLALALTETLKEYDRKDPCKYDFALFGIGAEERIK